LRVGPVVAQFAACAAIGFQAALGVRDARHSSQSRAGDPVRSAFSAFRRFPLGRPGSDA
jgi:hypothetical protein